MGTADRLLTICKPFSTVGGRNWFANMRLSRFLAVLLCLATICNLPAFFELRAISNCWDPVHKKELARIAPTDLRRDQNFNIYYRTIFVGLTRKVGPFVLVFVMTVAICHFLRRAYQSRVAQIIDARAVRR